MTMLKMTSAGRRKIAAQMVSDTCNRATKANFRDLLLIRIRSHLLLGACPRRDAGSRRGSSSGVPLLPGDNSFLNLPSRLRRRHGPEQDRVLSLKIGRDNLLRQRLVTRKIKTDVTLQPVGPLNLIGSLRARHHALDRAPTTHAGYVGSGDVRANHEGCEQDGCVLHVLRRLRGDLELLLEPGD